MEDKSVEFYGGLGHVAGSHGHFHHRLHTVLCCTSRFRHESSVDVRFSAIIVWRVRRKELCRILGRGHLRGNRIEDGCHDFHNPARD